MKADTLTPLNLFQMQVRLTIHPQADEPHSPRWNLTIEHDMPQGWRQHWMTENNQDDEVRTSVDQRVQTIGNLTLVNHRLNPSLPNRLWADDAANARGLGGRGKRTLLTPRITLHLNKDVVDQDQWDLDTIETRAR